MRWNGMPMAMWAVFAKSFQTQLTAALGYDADTAKQIAKTGICATRAIYDMSLNGSI